MTGVATEGVGTPLDGVRVVEASRTVATAYAGLILSDLGADVYRIDGPIDVAAPEGAVRVAAEQSLNRGKRRVRPDEMSEIERVLRTMDILLQDGGLQSEGALSASIAEATRPDAIIASAEAMGGQLSPGEPGAPGNGLTASAWSGLSIAIGSRGKPPLTLPFDLPDYQTGVNLAAAAILALIERDVLSGRCLHVEVVTAEVLAYYAGMISANFVPYGRAWRREGRRASGSGGVYPLGMFDCRDGIVAILCRTPGEWDALKLAMGSPEWSHDPRFADPRVIARQYADAADQFLIPWIAQQSVAQLVSLGREFGIPIAPIRTMSEAIADPQLLHRGYFETSGSQDGLLVPGRPFKLRDTEADAAATGTKTGTHWPAAAAGRPPGVESLLTGLRVLDLSWVWSGPMVTSILGDLGAEVIKVEHEQRMDPARLRGRSFRNGRPVNGPEHEVTPYFNQMNHGKQSLVADITTIEGQTTVRELASTCDVVVANLRPGVLERHGLGFADLAAVNPGLVMLSMSMAGQDGPLRNLKGYAAIMSAMAGIESLVGYDESDVVGMFTPAFGDPNGAAHGIAVLLAALYRRVRNGGRGTWIDLSQIETMMSILRSPVAEAQLCGKVGVPGNRHRAHVPHGHYPAREDDRWIAISVRSEAQWQACCRLADQRFGLGELAGLSESQREARRDDIDAAMAVWTRSVPVRELADRLVENGVPAAVVQTYDEMVDSLRARDTTLCRTVEHPYLGEQLIFFAPWRFDGKTGGRANAAPLLGADTESVLRDLATRLNAAANR